MNDVEGRLLSCRGLTRRTRPPAATCPGPSWSSRSTWTRRWRCPWRRGVGGSSGICAFHLHHPPSLLGGFQALDRRQSDRFVGFVPPSGHNESLRTITLLLEDVFTSSLSSSISDVALFLAFMSDPPPPATTRPLAFTSLEGLCKVGTTSGLM